MADLRSILSAVFLACSICMPALSLAQTMAGPGYWLVWEAGPGGGPVQGYRVYIQQNDLTVYELDTGLVTEASLEAMALPPGQYEAFVTAYNPVGESVPSDTLPFVYVVDLPGPADAPVGLRIERRPQ